MKCGLVLSMGARYNAWVAFLVATLASIPNARASCNVIPSAVRTFRSTTASINRPFASPGDPVEITFDPQCHGALREFGEGLGFRHVEAGPLVRSSYHARAALAEGSLVS